MGDRASSTLVRRTIRRLFAFGSEEPFSYAFRGGIETVGYEQGNVIILLSCYARPLMKNRYKVIGSFLISAALMLSACSINDRDISDDDSEETETLEESVSTYAYDEEAALSAFDDVLFDYQEGIQAYENLGDPSRCPSINYVDVTGDGINELVFAYVSGDNLFLDIYSYDDASGEAVRIANELLGYSAMGFDTYAESYLSSDIFLLNNGNLLIVQCYFRDGYYYQLFNESELYYNESNGYYMFAQPETTELLELDMYYMNDIELGPEVEPDDAYRLTVNGRQSMSYDEFFQDRQEYIDNIAIPLIPCAERCSDGDYEYLDPYGRVVGEIPASVFESGSYMYYEDFMNR